MSIRDSVPRMLADIEGAAGQFQAVASVHDQRVAAEQACTIEQPGEALSRDAQSAAMSMHS